MTAQVLSRLKGLLSLYYRGCYVGKQHGGKFVTGPVSLAELKLLGSTEPPLCPSGR